MLDKGTYVSMNISLYINETMLDKLNEPTLNNPNRCDTLQKNRGPTSTKLNETKLYLLNQTILK